MYTNRKMIKFNVCKIKWLSHFMLKKSNFTSYVVSIYAKSVKKAKYIIFVIYLFIFFCFVYKGEDLDWEAGLAYYELAKADGFDVTQLWARAALKLQHLLQENQQHIPWEVWSLYCNTSLSRLNNQII